MYCSESCKKQHKIVSHYKICSPKPMNAKDPWLETFERIKSTAVSEFGSLEEFNKLLKNPKKLTVFDVDELSPKNILAIFCGMAQSESRKKLFSEIIESNASFPEYNELKDVNIQVLTTYTTNSMTFTQFTADGKSNFKTGCTVSVFGSLFNHSCYTNIDRVTLDSKIMFYVNRMKQHF